MTTRRPTSPRFIPTLVALVAILCVVAFQSPAVAETTTVTIYHTSDLHAHSGNLARIARFVKDQKRKDPNVLLVDSGDWFNKGDVPIMITRGRAMAELLGACGYDAMALGNHEPSFGTKRLADLIDRFKLPAVAANYTWAEGTRPKNLESYRVVKLKGVTVALVGVGSEGIDHRTDELLTARRAEKALKGLIPKLREQAGIVVLVTHVGVQRDEQIAAAVPGIDVIMGGHHHVRFRKMRLAANNTTVIQHSGAYGGWLGKVVLTWNGRKITKRATALMNIQPAMPEDTALKAMRDKYFAALPPAKPIARADEAVTPAQLAKWLAEAVRADTKAHAVILPREIGKTPLPAAPITPQHLLKVVPRLSVVTFQVAAAADLDKLMVRLRKRRSLELAVFGKRAQAGTAIHVAYPCVMYDKILNTGALGLDNALVKEIKRIDGRSLWQIAITHARKHKTLTPQARLDRTKKDSK